MRDRRTRRDTDLPVVHREHEERAVDSQPRDELRVQLGCVRGAHDDLRAAELLELLDVAHLRAV